MRIEKQAKQDADAAFAFYRAKDEQKALSFTEELDARFKVIKKNPLAFPICSEDIRKFRMLRFPLILCMQSKTERLSFSQ